MQNSKIEWTDHTFNPWWGCIRVSPGCEHCYAETLANRYGHAVWGPAKTTPRRMMSENYWRQPIKWNEAARQSRQRSRVFCASMADVFEDHPQLVEPRRRLFNLIWQTQHLDWLLLTKRPENIIGMLDRIPIRDGLSVWDVWPEQFPNVWLGTSCEDQQRADERIPHLLKVPARVRFLSCEPLLGPVDVSRYLPPAPGASWAHETMLAWDEDTPFVDWIICGGESGHGARPMHPGWARGLRDQCKAAGVPFFFKQWGEYGPWPDGLPFNERAQVFQWQHTEWDSSNDHWAVRYEPHYRLGKHAAGNLLDGRQWLEMPS
jgi:protein gp37